MIGSRCGHVVGLDGEYNEPRDEHQQDQSYVLAASLLAELLPHQVLDLLHWLEGVSLRLKSCPLQNLNRLCFLLQLLQLQVKLQPSSPFVSNKLVQALFQLSFAA